MLVRYRFQIRRIEDLRLLLVPQAVRNYRGPYREQLQKGHALKALLM